MPTPPDAPDDAITPGSRIYETDDSVAQYLEFHYGAELFGVANFPLACIAAAVEHRDGRPWKRGLDVGCAVGRSSFEMARHADHVDAFDFSAAFVAACERLQAEGELNYLIPTEGLLREPRCASLKANGLEETAGRVQFGVGDACRLAAELTDYDVVFAGNLIDRLYEPAAFLREIVSRVVPGGLLVITSPYTWLEDYTPVDRWLGGRPDGGKTLDGMRQVLADSCDLVGCEDIPFVIRETARKHQHTVAEASFWRKH
ncbi:MAG: putative 4-mercaptohistidine N1-methyltransferase [Pirellulales bacterium]|jgi:putative 4-mercaptohistidine N1-methyltranferase|nr:putative 4-mercaptohistidine N1-methyltransferase [Pirellulales bacterium]